MRYPCLALLCMVALAATCGAASAAVYYYPDGCAGSYDWKYEGGAGRSTNYTKVDEHDGATSRDNLSVTATSWQTDEYGSDGSGSTSMKLIVWIKCLGPTGYNDYHGYYKSGSYILALDLEEPGSAPGPVWVKRQSTSRTVSSCSGFKMVGKRNPPCGTLLIDEIYLGT